MSSTFEGAHDFVLSASEINFGITNYYGHGGDSKATALAELRKHIAAGAMHNSDERCDAPKCHPETRVAVQEEAMGWILNGDGEGEEELEKILWLTGPAGGGKTAIMGSIAETCHKKGLLAFSFFFSSFVGSVNRRSKRCLVATMAYQLIQHDALRDVGECILASVERNPAIFEQQLEVQFDQLVLRPLRQCRRDSHSAGLPWPKVIVIDGLDECDVVQYANSDVPSSHVSPRTKEADQTEILHMLLKAVNDPSFPFRIIVASRPEPAIQSFFTDIASHITRKIFLDDKYNPDADMLLFLGAKFVYIRRRYHLPHSWPSDDVKKALVRNASGQFVYVATAMRFIGGSSAPPQELLAQVTELPVTDSTHPFAPLDALYTHILGSSSNPPLAVRWLRFIFSDHPSLQGVSTHILSQEPASAWFLRLFLESSPGEAIFVLGGLNSLISIPPTEDHTSPYTLFHKSLTDFLENESRCGDLFVDNPWDLYWRRSMEIWKDKGPATALTALEKNRFLDQYLEIDLFGSFVFEKDFDLYDIACASEINFGTTNYYGDGRGSKAAALERLRENIAAGAMHNSDERCDAPKCHPETRVAVQEEVVGWILDEAHKGEGASILWLTGPAGGGKTAIMGSIADICHQKGLLACGFFFSSFAGAASRRSKRCLVATMAYQLLQHDALRDVGERILSSVERNPAIFEQQLEVQLDQLVLRPLRECRRDPDGLPWPKVIVIDGLDECDAVQYIDIVQSPHVTPRTKEADQTEILYMLLEAANDPSFPFRIIVASRPEPAIQAFFNKDIASSTTRKIFLDAKYNPNADMLLFLDAKLSDIRRQYHLPHLWPSENLKQTLIDNASGQFIYVATAMRFIGGSSALPQELFSTVLHLPVMNVSSNPFAPLDALYSHIISSSSNPLLTVRWLCIIFVLFPALVNIHTATEYVSAWFSQLFMQSSPGEATYVLGGLHSLISIPPTEDHTSPYSLFHKSLTDFLTDGSRCGDLYVDGDAVGELYTHRYLEIWKTFEKAHDFTLKASEINFGTTNYYGHVGGSKAAALDKLREHIAAGAMHNSDERCSAPKCHPETRVAVQEETMAWILDDDAERAPSSMLWVTGPAGGGKTAIMGSVANTCYEKGLLACGFFFSSFAGSLNRRSKRCLVATMAYQLVQHEALRDVGERILSSVERNPAIFEQQLEVQLDQLVLRPLRESRRDPDGPAPWPKVVIIDGLDECDTVQHGENTFLYPHVNPRTKEEDQNEILHLLLKAANDQYFPFRIIIASRPEPTFQSFFTIVANHIAQQIFLDDKYNPNADMLLFLEAKFADIRRRYPKLPRSWPSEDVKQILIENASGQFIYVATVMRYVGGTLALPQELLDQVLKLRPTNASTNPFAPLDALYTHIIKSCPNPQLTASWLLTIFNFFPLFKDTIALGKTDSVSAWCSQLFLESSPGEATYVLGGLNSLIMIPAIEDRTSPYSLFHKSLTDFFMERSRCGDLYVEDELYLYTLRYTEIWKNKGPATTLDALEMGIFLDHYFTMHVLNFSAHIPERDLALYDISWWMRSQNERFRARNPSDALGLANVQKVKMLFLAMHHDCKWYRRCRPVCRYVRQSMLEELQKLGWTTPSGMRKLLRLKFTRMFDPEESGIEQPLLPSIAAEGAEEPGESNREPR
ncbi:hypothetical protein MD484_g8176, partial [Candolleomyces efflorescens]